MKFIYRTFIWNVFFLIKNEIKNTKSNKLFLCVGWLNVTVTIILRITEFHKLFLFVTQK